MKLFSFILSIVVFFVAFYFFMVKVPLAESVNDFIYISLLITLKAICVLGVIINWEIVTGKKKKDSVILFVNNSFSGKEKKNKKAK